MRIDRLKLNVASNFIATIWSILLNLFFVPIYIHLLGIEAYGLIGLNVTLQTTLTLLDLGLTPTMSREMARYSVLPEKKQEARDLARTLEVVYWGIAIIIGLGIIVLASPIAEYWIESKSLTTPTVRQAIMIMGIVAAIQWPVTLYAGGLQGLQDQLLLNGINIATSTLRFVGAALIVWLISPTITAFFLWQILTSGLQTSLLFTFFWQRLPTGQRRAQIQLHMLRSIRNFAVGMGAMSVISLLLMQADKIFLSRLLPLDQFGYYMLANMLAQSLLILSTPITNAVFPRFTQLVSKGDQIAITELSHRACQFISVSVLSTGSLLTIFSSEILLIWTHDSATVQQTHLLVSVLSVGSMCLALQTVPYTLAMAAGWIKLNIHLGIISIIVIIPLLLVLVNRYGSIGAGVAWIILNGASIPIYIHLLYRRLLPGEERHWYVQDVAFPLVAITGVMILGRWFTDPTWPTVVLLMNLVAIVMVAFFVGSMAAPEIRRYVFAQLQQIKLRQRRRLAQFVD